MDTDEHGFSIAKAWLWADDKLIHPMMTRIITMHLGLTRPNPLTSKGARGKARGDARPTRARGE
ncbi:MAG: hypothetical protein JWQ04_349 [Pedosphaera sp.]|nr:hypothetical protein [Pedosphaera sp.]